MTLLFLLTLAATPQPGTSLERARRLVNEGRCEAAEPLLRELARESSPEGEYFLGLCLVARLEHEQAETFLRRAIHRRPREHAWMHTLAKSLLDRGRGADAYDLLERALAIRDRPEYRFAKAVSAVDLGELDVAEEELGRALGSGEPFRFLDGRRVVDGRAEALFQLGKLLALRGRDEESRKALEEAVTTDPTHFEARLHLGLAQKRLGALDAARVSLERAAEERPESLAALYGLYQTLLASGDREGARRLGEKLGPLAEIESEIRFLLSATDSLERTLSDAPEDASIRGSIVKSRLALGERLVEAGRADEALQHLLAARRLEPERAETYRRLAAVFRLLGREADAEMAEGIARGLESRGR